MHDYFQAGQELLACSGDAALLELLSPFAQDIAVPDRPAIAALRVSSHHLSSTGIAAAARDDMQSFGSGHLAAAATTSSSQMSSEAAASQDAFSNAGETHSMYALADGTANLP